MGLEIPPGEFLRYPGADRCVSSTLEAYQRARSLSHLGRWRDQDEARRASLSVEKRLALARMPHVQTVTWPSRFLQQVATPLLPPTLPAYNVYFRFSVSVHPEHPISNPARASGVLGFMRTLSQALTVGHVRCLSLLGILSGGQTTTAGVALTQWLVSNCFFCFTCDFIGVNKNSCRC